MNMNNRISSIRKRRMMNCSSKLLFSTFHFDLIRDSKLQQIYIECFSVHIPHVTLTFVVLTRKYVLTTHTTYVLSYYKYEIFDFNFYITVRTGLNKTSLHLSYKLTLTINNFDKHFY